MKSDILKKTAALGMAMLMLATAGACGKDEKEKEPSQEPISLVMDTTISEKAYLSELVDPNGNQSNEPTSQTQTTPPVSQQQGGTVNNPTDASFFDDAVFVGDSVSLGLNYYVSDQRNYGECLGQAKFLTSGSLGSGHAVAAVSSESLHPTYRGEKRRIEDSIAVMQAKKVFIMLGMNDIALYGIDKSLENYKELVDCIIEKNPGIQIYAQSCTPMAQGCERSMLNNRSIKKYNTALQTLCTQNGWNYVDVHSVVTDADGFLRSDYCSDPSSMGIHFTPTGCAAWVNYLLNYVNNR